MTGKKFLAFLAALSLLALAVFGGGCGGGSRSSENEKQTGAAIARSVLVGGMNQARFASSDLAPYIFSTVVESRDASDLSNDISIFDGLNAGDLLFLGDADEAVQNAANDALLQESYNNSLREAYEKGAAIVAVYPDSKDVGALIEMLSLDVTLPRPDPKANDPHFELVAVAQRTMPNGTPHTFVYVADSDSNYGGLTSGDVTTPDGTKISPETAPDVSSGDTSPHAGGDTHNGDNSPDEPGLTTEEVEAELNASRVQHLRDWSAGLDADVQEMAAEVAAAEAKLQSAAVADAQKDILAIIAGVTTTREDAVSWSFKDYYEKIGKNDDTFKKFANKCDFDNPRLLNKYWSNFKVSRFTFTRYRVISLHSFDTHCDYYLVLSQSNTQPQSIAIRADKGINNGGEVPGAGANNYAVVLGFTKGLYIDIWMPYFYGDSQLMKYLPDQTVNKTKAYTDTKGWSLGGGVSFKGGVDSKGPSAEAQISFQASVSHTSSTTWQGQDYEIIPEPYGKYVTRWYLKVDYPAYSKGWHISTAAANSVTLDTESIWRVDPKWAGNFTLKGIVHWFEGFAWCHDTLLGDSWYMTAVNHNGGDTDLALPRPPHTALVNTSNSGGREGKLYSTKLYTEAAWSATKNVDWIVLEKTTGGATSGEDFYYTVKPNDTGKTRTGIITVNSGSDKVTLKFVQSPYAQ